MSPVGVFSAPFAAHRKEGARKSTPLPTREDEEDGVETFGSPNGETDRGAADNASKASSAVTMSLNDVVSSEPAVKLRKLLELEGEVRTPPARVKVAENGNSGAEEECCAVAAAAAAAVAARSST